MDCDGTRASHPAGTIAELFAQQAASRPEAVAIVSGHRQLTYAELDAQAGRLARHLRNRGVGPDRLVGVSVERSPDLIVVLLAILKAGGAYLSLDGWTQPERLRSILNDAQPVLIVVQSSAQRAVIAAAIGDAGGPLPSPDFLCLETDILAPDAEGADSPGALPESAADNLAYVCFTSGSTGGPKGVAIPNRGVVRLVRNTNYISISPGDVFLQFAPVSFDASTFEIWGALLNGARLAVCPPGPLTLAELGAVIRRHNVSVLWLTAGLFHEMVDQQLDSLKCVRQILAGGDVLSVPHVRKALEQLGESRLINGYGPTENTTFTCCHAITRASVEGRSIPIGRPIAHSQCYILDAQLQPVPPGVEGELFAGGDGLARGYINQPELTAQKFIANPSNPATRLYRTGDLARWLPDGNIEFLGRSDLLVKVRGYRIELGEIESCLQEHPGVSQAVVIAAEAGPGEKRLVAYFTSRWPCPPTVSELRAFLAGRLPDFMVPSAFMRLESLPLTGNGKVDRRALPALDGQRPDLDRDYIAPRDAVETQLVEIWGRLLAVKPIGVRDHFFELGGHSLLAARLFAQVEKLFGKRVPFSALYQEPTVEHLARLIRANTASTARSQLVAIQEKGSRPPLFLVHGAGGGMLWGYTNLAQHLGLDQPVYGFESRAMFGEEEYASIEDMARHYVQDLRALQPCGPYRLGGYCFGGNIAWEMARQLAGQRQRVALLALFEARPITNVAERVRWLRPRFAFEFALNILRVCGYIARLESRQRRNLLRRKWNTVVRRLAWCAGNSADLRQLPPVDLDDLVDVSQIPESERALWRAHLRIIASHVSSPYPGHLHLFRTLRQPLWCSFDPAYGWGELAAGVSLRFIPGAHENIFTEPNVRGAAAQLRRVLDETPA